MSGARLTNGPRGWSGTLPAVEPTTPVPPFGRPAAARRSDVSPATSALSTVSTGVCMKRTGSATLCTRAAGHAAGARSAGADCTVTPASRARSASHVLVSARIGPPPRLPSAPRGSASRPGWARLTTMTRSGEISRARRAAPRSPNFALHGPCDGQRARHLRRVALLHQEAQQNARRLPRLGHEPRHSPGCEGRPPFPERHRVEQLHAERGDLVGRLRAHVHPHVIQTLRGRPRVAASLEVRGEAPRHAGDHASARRPDAQRLSVDELVEQPVVDAGRDAMEAQVAIARDVGHEIPVFVHAGGDEEVRLCRGRSSRSGCRSRRRGDWPSAGCSAGWRR